MADWFSQNAPAQQASGGDWFAANAPAGGPPAEPSFASKAWDSLKQQPYLMGQEALGALKGAGKTAYNVGNMFTKAATFGMAPEVKPPVDFTPSNTAQQVGQAAEQVGEYFIPGGAISKGAKAIEGATAGVRGARLLAGAGRAALEGVGAGAVNYAQNQDPGAALKAAGTAGAVSGGMQAAGSLIPSAERIYNSALKPKKPLGIQSPQKVLEAQQRVAQTGIREGVPVSSHGLKRAEQITDQLNREIAEKVAQKSDELGPVIQPQAVASRVEQIKPQFQAQVNPEADVSALEGSQAEYLRKHTPEQKPAPTLYGADDKPLPGPPAPKPEPLTLSEAQSEKQSTYTQLRKKYGELGSAETEAQKALARGLKEEILSRVPELKQLNARDSSMIELENQLGNFVQRHNKRDLIDLKAAMLGSAMAGAGGASEGYHSGGWTGAATHGGIGALLGAALGNPAVKSRLAIAIDRAAGAGKAAVSAAPKIAAGAESIPQFAKGGVVAPSDAGSLGRVLSQKGFGRKGDTIHSGNHPQARQAASLIQKSSPGVKMHPASGNLDNLDPKNGIFDHIKNEMADFLRHPASRRVIVSTHEGQGSEVHRIAPGHKGKWQAAPIDLNAAKHLRQGIYLVRHPAPGKAKASKAAEKPMPNGLRPIPRLS